MEREKTKGEIIAERLEKEADAKRKSEQQELISTVMVLKEQIHTQ